MKILIVDDEPELLEQLRRILVDRRYVVETVKDGESALDRLFETPFDLIILDIMLPRIDGFSLLKELRGADIKTPVLMLTAKSGVNDRVKGLNLGADDYLAKPFSVEELIARVGAILRRYGNLADPVLQVGDLKLNTIRREVTREGHLIELTPKEFAVLEFLLYNKNRVISRFNLAERVWGDNFDTFSMSNFMDVHIKNLRAKIGDAAGTSFIQTIRGVGYVIRDPEA
ncbi:MAG: response regulator transcription factor [Pseudomonadota bacterium]